MGVFVDLQSSIPIFVSRSSVYFLWERNIPCFDRATSMPNKYFKHLRFFILNSYARCVCRFKISSSSFPVMIISLTYIIKVVTFPFWCFKNRVWSELLCLYPCFFIVELNWPNHARRDCFRPYNAFYILHTYPTCKAVKPGGISTYTSSSKSPYKNAFFISNWWRTQSKFVAREINTLTVFNFATEEKVS